MKKNSSDELSSGTKKANRFLSFWTSLFFVSCARVQKQRNKNIYRHYSLLDLSDALDVKSCESPVKMEFEAECWRPLKIDRNGRVVINTSPSLTPISSPRSTSSNDDFFNEFMSGRVVSTFISSPQTPFDVVPVDTAPLPLPDVLLMILLRPVDPSPYQFLVVVSPEALHLQVCTIHKLPAESREPLAAIQYVENIAEEKPKKRKKLRLKKKIIRAFNRMKNFFKK